MLGAPRRALATALAIGRRGVEAALVVVLLSSLVFFALRLLPGDPAALVLGDRASPEELAALRHRLGLDTSLGVQYARFLWGLLRFDFGASFRHPELSARSMVFDAIGPTGALAVVAVAFAVVGGVGAAVLGVAPWLGHKRAWIHWCVTLVSATPMLSFAPLVTYVVAVRWRVLPLPGDPDAGALGLGFAAGLLSVPLAAQLARIGRAALREVERSPFLHVARAKGASQVRVWLLHAVPAASGPMITVVAAQLGALLGGAVVLEKLFERPGLGTLILEAYAARDLPVLESAVTGAGLVFVVVQTLGALLHAVVDPRVRK